MDIWTAIRKGDSEYVQKYINDGCDLEAKDFSGRTPIIYAICDSISSTNDKSNVHIAKLLIDAGCDINTPIYLWGNEYFYPIHYSSFKCLKLMIDSGSDIDAVSSNSCQTVIIEIASSFQYSDISVGSGPFMDNIYDNTIKTIKLLIESGCRLDIKDKNNHDYKQYLYWTNYFAKHKEKVEQDLADSFRIRYSRSSLLELCCYHIKNDQEQYKDGIHLLNKDIKKLILDGTKN